MKVLLVAPSPPPAGGIQSVTENLLKYIQNNKNGTDIMLYNTTHQFRPMTSQSLFIRIITGILNSLKTYFKVVKHIKKDTPELIHLASSSSLALIKDYLIVNAANQAKIPVVMHWHFGRIPSLKKKNNWEWRLLSRVINKSSMSIVIDQKSYHSLIEAGSYNVACIPNPMAIDIEEIARGILKNPNSRKKGQLIYVGHIIKEKGIFELIEACLPIKEISELVLIGPCQENIKKEIIKLTRTRDEGKWIKFTGELTIKEVISYMKQAPILSLPSYTEGFPMVILEAMAMGCAIIASDVGAIPEMLGIKTPTPCGICIPAKNQIKLKNAINNLINNKTEIKTLGNRAINRVLETYTTEKAYNQYKEIWSRAIKNQRLNT
jgi:glycosyltransferase involved in cell wall biosynthesis